jgi:hypothetical protein
LEWFNSNGLGVAWLQTALVNWAWTCWMLPNFLLYLAQQQQLTLFGHRWFIGAGFTAKQHSLLPYQGLGMGLQTASVHLADSHCWKLPNF